MLLWICSLNYCNSSILEQHFADVFCCYIYQPLFSYWGWSMRAPFHHHHLCYPFLLFYLPHLYVTFLLSATHSALSVCKMCTFFFHLVLLQNEKKVTGFDIKLSYLPTTARLCSEPHAIWKRSMNELKKPCLPVWRQPPLWQEIKN